MTQANSLPSFRLAIVLSHPTQYFSPWFKHITEHTNIDLKLFYLWDFGVEKRHDPSFGLAVKWDIPLLDGYEHEFVQNISHDPGTHHFTGLNNPGVVSALVTWKPDAILLFGYNYLSHVRVLLSWRLRKIPMLQRGDSHDLSRAQGWRVRLKRQLRSTIFKRFVGFLSVGKANAQYLRNSGVSNHSIHFVPHCVDNQRFQSASKSVEQLARAWREELGIPEAARVFLFAGKFENKKRPQDLLAAFLSINFDPKGENTSPVLLLVGAGELESQLRKIAGNELGRTIFFAPFQNQTQMPKVYAACDLLVLPSYGSGETWGLSINEAMSIGKPVIVSSHVGCGPDLVRNGSTGWIFEAGNLNALAEVVATAISLDDESLCKMGELARAHVDLYSYDAATSALMKILDEQIVRHKGKLS